MVKRRSQDLVMSFLFVMLAAPWFATASDAQSLAPISFRLKILPQERAVEVKATVPTEGQKSIVLMMPVWSPGFYSIQNYAEQLSRFEAKTVSGEPLEVERTRNNRWKITTGEAPAVVVTYQLECRRGFVTLNEVTDSYAALNGCPTFVKRIEQQVRPYEVDLELPDGWSKSATALPRLGGSHHYRASDYDELVDSPIVAGQLSIVEFEVNGCRHYWVDVGDFGNWDAADAVEKVKKIVEEHHRFWGELPFRNYYFLNVFRRGGGGLEHKDSTLLTASQSVNRGWLQFICHEYFHAFNVKRLRPIQLGPFDYEIGPRTDGLWIAEGLTNYYADLLVARAGLSDADGYLSSISKHIRDLQNAPGRLEQSLAEASLTVWDSKGMSGVGVDRNKSISYYTKGPVAGFLLDAKIRELTRGRKNLDDVIRLAYSKYSGKRGFTAKEFQECAEEIADASLQEWFQSAIYSTDELEYDQALAWYGLKFSDANENDKSSWQLQVDSGAGISQKERFQSLITGR